MPSPEEAMGLESSRKAAFHKGTAGMGAVRDLEFGAAGIPGTESNAARIFYTQILTDRQAALLWRQQGHRLVPVSRSEAAEWISIYARALQSLDVPRGARIALMDVPETILLPAMLAHMLLGIASVVLADDISQMERMRLLTQSNVSLILAEDANTLSPYLREAALLPRLQNVVTLQHASHLAHQQHMPVTVSSLEELMQRGRALPDRTRSLLERVKLDEAALLIGARVEALSTPNGAEDTVQDQVELRLRTQAQLLATTDGLRKILEDANIAIAEGEPILAHPAFEHPVDFIATQILPMMLGCPLDHIGPPIGETEHFQQLQPHLLISRSTYLTQLHQRLERQLTQEADGLDRWAARKLLALGKKRYEKSGKLSFLQSIMFNITRQMVGTHVLALLGGRLRGILSTDEDVPYATQLFFETFGVKLAEVPHVFEKEFEKRRL